MIVLDTNVLAALYVQSNKTDIVSKIWEQDSDWHLPYLWISEFRNVLAKYYHAGRMNAAACDEALAMAHNAVLPARTHSLDDTSVMKLCMSSKCTAYDCEYVALAVNLEAPLVTWDQAILRAFPAIAMAPEKFLSA